MAKKGKREKKIDLSSHYIPNTGQAKHVKSYKKADDLKVEETLKKDKEVREKDVFDFSSKKK